MVSYFFHGLREEKLEFCTLTEFVLGVTTNRRKWREWDLGTKPNGARRNHPKL